MPKSWLFKVVGEKIEHLHPISGKLVSSAILHLKSTIWPGFNLFYKEGEIFKIYIGNGEKYSSKSFFPKLTYAIQGEKEDLIPIDETSAIEKPAEVEPVS